MKNRAGLWVGVLWLLGVLVWPHAQALTLGDLTGVAVLGRALDVKVKVQADASEPVITSCVAADVFHADMVQRAPVVSVQSTVAGEFEVRIQSAAMVNEPVVSVLVRSNCGTSTQRRYVLLADFPTSAALAPEAAVVASPASNATAPTASITTVTPMLVLPAAQQPELGAVAVLKTPKKPQAAARAKAHAAGTTASAEKTTPAKKTKAIKAAPASTATPARGTSVLKLDPLEVFSDRMDSIDNWMTFEPTEDALKQTKQIAELQNDLKTMRQLSAKNNAQLLELTSRLEQAQAQQLPALLVYVLLALVVLCLAALGWLWRKQQHQRAEQAHWWQPDDVSPTVLMPQAQAPAPVKTPPPVAKLPEVDLDIDLDNFIAPAAASLAESSTAPVATSPQPPTPVVEPLPQLPRTARRIHADDILDIRQQADFFLTLGQSDRALRLLKAQIDESAEPNPTVYLDLIGLYHMLGMKVDYREVRTHMLEKFNVLMPDFPAYNLGGKDLEDYPEVVANVSAVWPQALAFLDACIFHDPAVQVRPTFELTAFRDLLLLHALAEDLTEPTPTPSTEPSLIPPPPLPVPVMPALALPVGDAELSLVPNPVSDAAPASANESLPDIEVLTPPPEESPTSMMLDLDFSSLALTPQPSPPATLAERDPEPIAAPKLPYATRARAPALKKPK